MGMGEQEETVQEENEEEEEVSGMTPEWAVIMRTSLNSIKLVQV